MGAARAPEAGTYKGKQAARQAAARQQKSPGDEAPGLWDWCDRREDRSQCFSSSGTLPPFWASFVMTCFCSHTFMVALSFVSPV